MTSTNSRVRAAAGTAPSIDRPRRKRKRKIVLGLGPRMFLAVIIAALTIVACCAFAAKIAQPYGMERRESAQLRALQNRLTMYHTSNDRLRSQIAYLQRPDGVENAARAEGYVRAGEISVEVNTASPAVSAAPQSRGFADMVRRAWHDLTSRS